MASPSTWQPEWVVAPGEVLAGELDDRGMSQSELARRMDRPTKTINEIVNAKAAITAETALQLELALGVSARFWLGLEGTYRERTARTHTMKALGEHEAWAQSFPLAAMRRLGLLDPKSKRGNGEAVASLLSFFGLGNVSAYERLWGDAAVAWRRSPSFQPSSHALSAWLRWGELLAADIDCQPFDRAALEREAARLPALSQEEPFSEVIDELRERLAACGVALVLTRELPDTHVSGAARWLSKRKAVLQLTLRHKRDDHFWFSFMHEIAHLLDPSGADHIDLYEDDADEPIETRANERARDLLLDQDAYEEFLAGAEIDTERVRAFAAENCVSPGIVVGRLQRDGHLAPNQLTRLLRRIDWA